MRAFESLVALTTITALANAASVTTEIRDKRHGDYDYTEEG